MSVRRVSPAEAQALCAAGYRYVDVRSEMEFEHGRPAGSVNVPLMHVGPGGMRPNSGFVQDMKALFATDTKLVLGCKAGGRSLRAAQLLIGAGFSDVIDQRAGFDGARDASGGVEPGWGRVGLPTVSGDPGAAGYAALKADGL